MWQYSRRAWKIACRHAFTLIMVQHGTHATLVFGSKLHYTYSPRVAAAATAAGSRFAKLKAAPPSASTPNCSTTCRHKLSSKQHVQRLLVVTCILQAKIWFSMLQPWYSSIVLTTKMGWISALCSSHGHGMAICRLTVTQTPMPTERTHCKCC